MTEATHVWLPVKEALEPFLMLERIEMRSKSGIPDVYWCGMDVLQLRDASLDTRAAGWLELKIEEPKAKKITTLTIDQCNWMWRHQRKGGRAGILCRQKDLWSFWPPKPGIEWPDRMMMAPFCETHSTFTQSRPTLLGQWLLSQLAAL